MQLSHKYTIVRMMHVSGHHTRKILMDYIKLFSDEIHRQWDQIGSIQMILSVEV